MPAPRSADVVCGGLPCRALCRSCARSAGGFFRPAWIPPHWAPLICTVRERMVARAKRHSLYAVFHPALGPGGVRGRRGTQGRRRRYCTHKRRLIARGSAQGATLTQWLVLCAACAREVEVQIISPRPGTHVPSGAVPLRARLAMRAVATVPPTGWALSISLGEDGESTVVPGVEVNGELPALPPGAHSVTIALVDA